MNHQDLMFSKLILEKLLLLVMLILLILLKLLMDSQVLISLKSVKELPKLLSEMLLKQKLDKSKLFRWLQIKHLN